MESRVNLSSLLAKLKTLFSVCLCVPPRGALNFTANPLYSSVFLLFPPSEHCIPIIPFLSRSLIYSFARFLPIPRIPLPYLLTAACSLLP